MKLGIKYHKPELLPLNGLKLDANIFTAQKSEAEYRLGQLQGSGSDGLGKRFFNPQLLVSPLATKEAVMSSKIEGTISTVSDVYRFDAGQETKFSGTKEVYNYRRAISRAMYHVSSGKRMDKTHIKELHKMLLTGVRHDGVLGDFRAGDVWIGEKKTDPIEKALYVPPHFLTVDAHIDNLMEYIEKSTDDPLTKAGMAHYQFEAVHPFDDGNGRVGRLLIPLILYENKRLTLPILYMSGYFDSCRIHYQSALRETDKTMEYEAWLKFFFHSVGEQAKQTLEIIEKINLLYEETAKKVMGSKSPFLLPFLGYLFDKPIFSPSEAVRELKTTYLPIKGLIKLFVEKGVLIETQGIDRRKKIYIFEALIDLLSNV